MSRGCSCAGVTAVRVAYRPVADLDGALAWLAELAPRTVIFGVEPLVARWNSDVTALDHGVGDVLARLVEIRCLDAIAFSTNSLRRFEGELVSGNRRVLYLAAARKPLVTKPYRSLPGPGVVVGDQLATDGLLAWRLGYAFAHVRPTAGQGPLGSRWMGWCGRPLAALLFDRAR